MTRTSNSTDTASAEGAVTLHASAVAVDGAAIGFMAPKFHGKSTLAAAMTYVGAHLVSDDALAILPEDRTDPGAGDTVVEAIPLGELLG